MDKAVGIMEFGSVTRGLVATDEVLKTADVRLLNAQTVCPGKYLLMFSGDISAVSAACERASVITGGPMDTYVAGRLPEEVLQALKGTSEPGELESLGIIETFSIPSALEAADAAVKASGVSLLEIRASRGMGGKSFVLMTGPVSAVNAAVDSVRSRVDAALLLDAVVIPRPDPSIWSKIV